MKKLLAIFVLFFLAAVNIKAQTLFQDDFEGGLAAEWQGRHLPNFVVTQANSQYGSWSVTTNRLIDQVIYVDFGQYLDDVTLTGWFYDDGASISEALFSVARDHLDFSSEKMLSLGLDTRQSKTNYALFNGHQSHDMSLARSVGWHRADFYLQGGLTQIFLDGLWQEDNMFAGSWRYIYLYANGWEGQLPDNPQYWDNVSVYVGAPRLGQTVPEPSPLAIVVASLVAFGIIARFINKRRGRGGGVDV